MGVIATLAPHIFYDRVPWVSLAPPYSEHLMRDYGAMNLALALVAVVAAITMDRLMVRTLLSAYVLFVIPQLIFHVTHHQHYTTAQAAGETAALVVSVLLPVGLLVLTAGMTSSTSRTPSTERAENPGTSKSSAGQIF